MFSSDPPLCVFSPSRRLRDNTTKHTLENIFEVPECVINVVSYNMVQQVSLARAEFPRGTNEFLKAGFTELKSELVRPPRVAESPVQLECTVREVISLGEQPGAGNLVLADVKLIHIHEHVLDDSGKIDQERIDLVARLGGDWYCRVTKDTLFKIPRPGIRAAIGFDLIPSPIKNSVILTANNLAQLAGVDAFPSDGEIESMKNSADVKEILDATFGDPHTRGILLHQKAREYLDNGNVTDAWKILLV